VVRTMLRRSINSCSLVVLVVAGSGAGISTNANALLLLEEAESSVAPAAVFWDGVDCAFECLHYQHFSGSMHNSSTRGFKEE